MGRVLIAPTGGRNTSARSASSPRFGRPHRPHRGSQLTEHYVAGRREAGPHRPHRGSQLDVLVLGPVGGVSSSPPPGVATPREHRRPPARSVLIAPTGVRNRTARSASCCILAGPHRPHRGSQPGQARGDDAGLRGPHRPHRGSQPAMRPVESGDRWSPRRPRRGPQRATDRLLAAAYGHHHPQRGSPPVWRRCVMLAPGPHHPRRSSQHVATGQGVCGWVTADHSGLEQLFPSSRPELTPVLRRPATTGPYLWLPGAGRRGPAERGRGHVLVRRCGRWTGKATPTPPAR